MNERIRELAKQAGINFFECTNPEHGGREYCEAWIEQQQKFAKLIVQECLNVINKINSDDPGEILGLHYAEAAVERYLKEIKE